MRYALGVGIGTPVVALLWKTYANALSPHVRIPSPFAGTISALLWAAAGMAYCYVASVPMLTLHSTRRLLRRTPFSVYMLFFSLTAILIIAAVLDIALFDKVIVLQIAGFCALISIACAQLVSIMLVLKDPSETHHFYDQLGLSRKLHPDYVESYRHMREHGNSISIVLCELLLAFVLWSLKPIPSAGNSTALVARVGIILGVWLAPASLVWLIGSSLERHLTRSNDG